MYYFHNDYNETCHPAILERIQEIRNQQVDGYGEDPVCAAAAHKIRALCGNMDLAVHFIAGGTQANLTVIAAALRPHQAVLAAESGHVQVHETGAIEATGHKVIPLPSKDGKISGQQVREAVECHWADTTHEHMPQPKLVYISQPTEYGTTYSIGELEALSTVCREKGLLLYVDGARLGYALAAAGNDVNLPELARLADAFYIGGTKVGAMLGEAIVLKDPGLQADFRYILKQRGGMLAKGWLLGLQFAVLLEDDLYWRISGHANRLADRLRDTLDQLGYSMPVRSRTNQVFVTLPLTVCNALEDMFTFSPWAPPSGAGMTVRFCTSWATTPESVTALCEAIKNITNSQKFHNPVLP